MRKLPLRTLTEAAWKQFVAAHPTLQSEPVTVRAQARGAASGTAWFDGRGEDRSWVVLAACLDRETAKEDELDGEPHGLFTAALLRRLRKVPPESVAGLRWMDLFTDVRRDVVERAPALGGGEQTPVLEGRPEKEIFGSAWTPFEPGFSVRGGEAADELTLDGGLIDGLEPGAEIDVYPPETASFREADAAGIAVVKAQIVSATPSESRARVVPGSGPAATALGHARPLSMGPRATPGPGVLGRARLTKPGPAQPLLGVRLTGVPADIAAALKRTKDAANLLVLDPPEGRIDVEVRPWSEAIPAWMEWEAPSEKPLWVGTPGGWIIVPFNPSDTEPVRDDVIAYVPPPDAPGVEDGAAGVGAGMGRALVHWARFQRALRVAHVDETLQSLVTVGLRRGEAGSEALESLSPGPSGEYTVMDGEPIWVQLRARKEPLRRVFVAFLACSGDGNTVLQWPSEGGAPTLAEIDGGEELSSGQTLLVGEDRFQPARPQVRLDKASSLYTFKVIAAVVPPGATPPALRGLQIPDTVQDQVVKGVARKTRGSLRPRSPLGADAWCTWDLPVRVVRR